MVSAVDFLRDLHDFLFLQGFCDLYEVSGLSGLEGGIDISSIVQPHDSIPFQGFLEDFEGLGLLLERGEIAGTVAVRDAQKYASVEQADVPDFQVAGARDKDVVVVVGRLVEGVVIDIDLAAGLQNLDLVVHPEIAEQFDGFPDLHVVASELDVFLHYSLHPGSQGLHVSCIDRNAVSLVYHAVVALGNRPSDDQLAFRENVPGGLVEQEAE